MKNTTRKLIDAAKEYLEAEDDCAQSYTTVNIIDAAEKAEKLEKAIAEAEADDGDEDDSGSVTCVVGTNLKDFLNRQ